MIDNFLLAILLLVCYGSLVLVHSQGQSGFISLDCGLPENSTYTEPTTDITYISDAAFVNGGESRSILPLYKPKFQRQVERLRSFPQGIRNCYKINTKKGTKYLIRATFLYGNYDGRNKTPEFDLHLGANLWDTVKLQGNDIDTSKEIIHFPTQNYARVCLVNTGSGTPFISALELRPLKNSTYEAETGTSLSLVVRMDIGSTTNSTYRYPYDVFDRLWVPYSSSEWTSLATSLSVQNFIGYEPPVVVMSSAGTPANASAPFSFRLDSEDPNIGYYLYTYVAEFQELKVNESRSFGIKVNGKQLYGNVVPGYLTSTALYSTVPITGELNYTFTYEKHENSTLPPIVNAVEIYALVDFSQSETNQDDVDAVTNIKSSYGVKRNWEGDPCFPVKYLWTGLSCTSDGSTSSIPPRITSLDLSSSELTGEISTYIGNLNMLEFLDLSNNSLSGAVPIFLSQLPSLKFLNLEKNELTGLVPPGLIDRSNDGSLQLRLEENQDLCGSSPCKKKKSKPMVPIVASVGGSLLALVTAIFFLMRLKKKKKKPVYLGKIKESFESKKRRFTYSEITRITKNFKRVLGKGGFGTVYHGVVDDGTEVAVKIINVPQSDESNKGKSQEQIEEHYQQFQAEAKLLLTVYHGNLTSLVGYCKEGTRMALIYEYMANGDLESHLKGKQGNVLSWEKRLQIAIDSAQGLEYLHVGCKPLIVHRDIKPANILITDDFRAKLADFGLSKFFATIDGTHVSTVHMAGSPGYIDPDPMNCSWLNEKTDVYSFGVVLLQIITSRPAISRTGEDEWTHISQWVKLMIDNGNLKDMVDRKLEGDFELSSMWKAVEIAMACVSWTAIDRPNMSQVVIELRECLVLELARKTSSKKSNDERSSLNMTTELHPRAR